VVVKNLSGCPKPIVVATPYLLAVLFQQMGARDVSSVLVLLESLLI
jgi:hypothetical protein